MEYTLLIVAIPLILFLVLGLGGHRMRPQVAGLTGTLGMGLTALLSYTAAAQYFSGAMAAASPGEGRWSSIVPLHFEWLRFTEHLHIDLGILLDPISVMMLVVISTVSLMVHLYSLGYMKGERGFQRYYACLSLFSFSMLGLVVATNIFQMYIFWELVGVSSYSLIGFYYTRPSAVAAAKKAFIVTRFADLGFLVGILLLSFYTGTFDFAALTSGHAALVVHSTEGLSFMGCSVAAWAMALIFMGGAGKSAMLPLHVWLPDAMEGPTPVSALIHAATMVVAGVYLVARLFPVYIFAAPQVLEMIAAVGAFTALFAAVVAITQTDIKRVLAFSTISQIAYMMVALGVSGYGDHEGLGYMASMFHLFTHAFFKALLFLGAGSVIHAVHSNEMSAMGNLRRYMPVTHLTFLAACLAIAGIWPLSGFFSKDEVMAAAFHHWPVVGWTLWVVAGLTAFYMFRLYFCIFWNGKREYDAHHPPHESPAVMTVPLLVLAALSVCAGWIPFGNFVSSDNLPLDTHLDPLVAVLSLAVAVAGIGMAFVLYANNSGRPAQIARRLGGVYRASLNKFYGDELWMFVTQSLIFKGICEPVKWFDRHIVDGAMNGLAWATQKASSTTKGLQSGYVQAYAWFFAIGVLVIAILTLLL
jgi:NADH-quinone oxidoreductase subunit L